MSGRVRLQPAQCLRELPFSADLASTPGLVPRNRHVHETLEEVALLGRGGSPCILQLFVSGEVLACANQLEARFICGLETVFHGGDPTKGLSRHADARYAPRVATILLCGVDLFFRGKLDVLLPGHHFVTADTIAEPELVIADISRIEPEEVADTYPDIPIVGFASHTDTAGLRRAHAAGFDQVLAKSALQDRAPEVIGELLAPLE